LACEAIHKSAEPNSLMVRIGLERRDALLSLGVCTRGGEVVAPTIWTCWST
jgi:hypothetical protein